MSSVRQRIFVNGLLLTGVLSASPVAAQRTYFISESTDFTGNGCQNSDLNDVTSELTAVLKDLFFWTGRHFVNSDAWPHDFVESCSSSYGSGGLDISYADSKALSVYAGHGNRGLIQFGYEHNNRCTVDFSANMRLGSMNGADSGYGMWLTSCTLNTDSLVAEANHQWLQQQFGYHNSPEIKDDQPAWFARYVHSGWTNRSAWLDQMEDRPGWFTGDNSPIVVTYGQNEADCNNLAQTLSLGNSVAPRGGGPSCGQGQPYFWYCGTLLNNGGC